MDELRPSQNFDATTHTSMEVDSFHDVSDRLNEIMDAPPTDEPGLLQSIKKVEQILQLAKKLHQERSDTDQPILAYEMECIRGGIEKVFLDFDADDPKFIEMIRYYFQYFTGKQNRKNTSLLDYDYPVSVSRPQLLSGEDFFLEIIFKKFLLDHKAFQVLPDEMAREIFQGWAPSLARRLNRYFDEAFGDYRTSFSDVVINNNEPNLDLQSFESEEQYLMALLIASIGPKTGEQGLNLMLSIADTYGTVIPTQVVAEVAKKIDKNLAVEYTLLTIESSQQVHDEHLTKTYLRVLRHLEQKEVILSPETKTLSYIGNIFHLIDIPEGAATVHRITPQGDLGVLDRNGTLLCYIEGEELFRNLSPGGSAELHCKPIERALLTTQEMPSSEYEKFFQEYTTFYNNEFFKTFSIYPDSLTLREQLWFWNFFQNANDAQKQQARELTQNFGEAGLRTFIACEIDPQGVAYILAIAHSSLSPQLQKRIFDVYSDFIFAIDRIESVIGQSFTKAETATQVSTANVTKEISLRGYSLLKRLAQQVSDGEAEVELIHQLQNLQADTSIFGAVLKDFLKQKEKVDFSEIAELSFETLQGNELADEQKEKMLEIFSANYRDEPEFIGRFKNFLYPTSAEGRQKLTRNTFSLLWHKKEKTGVTLLAFLRLEDTLDGRVYFAACNANPKVRGSGLVAQLLKHTVAEAIQHKPVDATFPPDSPVGTHYIDALGFVGTGMKLELGKYRRFVIQAEPNTPEMSVRNQSKGELEALANNQKGIIVEELITNNTEVVVRKFNSKTEKEKIDHDAQTLFSAGYIMPRYTCVDTNCTERYYCFQKTNSSEKEETPTKSEKVTYEIQQ